MAAAADPDRRIRLGVGALVFGAAALIAFRLGTRSFWLDEAYTASTIDRSFGALVALTFRDEGYQILHQLLLWPWGRISSSETWLRLPSALMYVATVAAIARTGRRHFDARTGLFAAVLFGANGFAILLGQEARSYPFAMFSATFALDAFLAARAGTASPWRWSAWAGAAAWFHGFATLAVVAPVVVVLPSLVRDPIARRRWFAPLFVTAAAVVVPVALPSFQTDVANDYAFLPDLSFAAVRDVAFALLGRSGVFAGLLVGALALAAIDLARRGEHRSQAGPVWAMAVLPAVALTVASIAQPILLDRYLAASLPAIALLAGMGLAAVPSRSLLQLGTVVVLVAASSVSIARAIDRRPIENWRDAVATLADRAQPGDALLVSVDEELVALEYYRPRSSRLSIIDLAWPRTRWGTFSTGDQGPEPLSPDAASEAIARIAPAPDRIWIVDAKAAPGAVDAIVAALDGYGPPREQRWDGLRVLVLERR